VVLVQILLHNGDDVQMGRDILKKAVPSREGQLAAFELIRAENDNLPAAVLCAVPQVSRAGCCAWWGRPLSASGARRQVLTVKVRGTQRVYRNAGQCEGRSGTGLPGRSRIRETVARIIQIAGSLARKKRRREVTTDSRHIERIAEESLWRDFSAMSPNEIWMTDVTAIWSTAGWVYLTAVLDLSS
jgi:transposase InsO family protein